MSIPVRVRDINDPGDERHTLHLPVEEVLPLARLLASVPVYMGGDPEIPADVSVQAIIDPTEGFFVEILVEATDV